MGWEGSVTFGAEIMLRYICKGIGKKWHGCYTKICHFATAQAL